MTDDRPGRAGANSDPFALLGLRSFINCCGSRTIFGGSRMPKEVLEAMVAASTRFVNVPQLLEAAGKRIADLVGAPAALVTTGGSGALFVGAAGAATRGDPERLVRLPHIDWPQRHIVMPRGSRFGYDHAMRATGLEIVEAGTREEMAAALDTAAMVAVLGTADPTAPLKLEDCVALARPRGVPVLVDAASEFLKKPDPYLARGADMVVYSGGKYLRGPQSTGLLIGVPRWITAAGLTTAPHNGIGRQLKVSKEEVAGLVAAVELWASGRDAAREEAAHIAELRVLALAAEKCPGVACEFIERTWVEEPTPRLRVRWDRARIGIDGPTLRQRLMDGDPSVLVDDRFAHADSITILPLNLQPGEAVIVGQRIAAELASAPAAASDAAAEPPAINVSGRWVVTLEAVGGEIGHVFELQQQGSAVSGTHHLRTRANPIRGTVAGDRVRLESDHPVEGLGLSYRFTGRLQGLDLVGTAELGTTGTPVNRREYGDAPWRARRA